MRVLGIETSCDETAAAVYDGERRPALASALQPGATARRVWRGRAGAGVPRSRPETVAADRAGAHRIGSRLDQIDGVAYTAGPGLVGALLVGASVARSLAFAWNRPAIGVHHLEGHLLAPMLEVDGARVSIPGAVGVGRSHLARRGPRARRLPDHRLVRRRCGRRGLRQDREASWTAVSGRAGAREDRAITADQVGSNFRARCSIDLVSSSVSADSRLPWSSRRAACSSTIRREPTSPANFSKPSSIRSSRSASARSGRRVCDAGGRRRRRRESSTARSAAALGDTPQRARAVSTPRVLHGQRAMIAYAGYRRLAAGATDDLAIRATARWPLERCNLS